jgi:hypothetical protein
VAGAALYGHPEEIDELLIQGGFLLVTGIYTSSEIIPNASLLGTVLILDHVITRVRNTVMDEIEARLREAHPAAHFTDLNFDMLMDEHRDPVKNTLKISCSTIVAYKRPTYSPGDGSIRPYPDVEDLVAYEAFPDNRNMWAVWYQPDPHLIKPLYEHAPVFGPTIREMHFRLKEFRRLGEQIFFWERVS